MLPIFSIHRGRARASLSLGSYLLLAAACPSGQTATTDGASDSDTSSGTTTTSGTTAEPTISTTTADPTTSTSSTTDPGTSSTTGPAVCGDGVVAETEVCDDGNDDPDDGCNKSCEKTGAVEWTYTYNGAAGKHERAGGVAIDATGRILVAGIEQNAMGDTDMLLIALAPDGTELWRQTFAGAAGEDDGFVDVAVDEGGNIYASGYEGTTPDSNDSIVRAFDPDGGELWIYSDPAPVAGYSNLRDAVVAAGALYSVGVEGVLDAENHLVVRRHDLGTGQTAWKTPTQAGTMGPLPQAITVLGGDIIVVGAAVDDNESRPLIAVFTDAGALVSTDIEDHLGGVWFDVAPIGAGGDLVLAGRRVPEGVTGADIAVRRIGPDFSEQWTQLLDHNILYDSAQGVAVGPGEAIFVAGVVDKEGEDDNVFGGRFAPDGTLLWTHTYNNAEADSYDDGWAAAFGTDYVIIAGRETQIGQGSNVWVRRLKAD